MRAKIIRFLSVCLIGLLGLSLAACSSTLRSTSLGQIEEPNLQKQELEAAGSTGGEEKPTLVVYTSFFPIYDLAGLVIGKENIDLRCFMPPTQDPHLWEPTPRDLKNLDEADLLIINGANMEERWLGSVREILPVGDFSLVDSVELNLYGNCFGRFSSISAKYSWKRVVSIPLSSAIHQDLMDCFFRQIIRKKKRLLLMPKKLWKLKAIWWLRKRPLR